MLKKNKYLKDSKNHIFKVLEVKDLTVIIEDMLTGTTTEVNKIKLINKIESGKIIIGTDLEVFDESNN